MNFACGNWTSARADSSADGGTDASICDVDLGTDDGFGVVGFSRDIHALRHDMLCASSSLYDPPNICAGSGAVNICGGRAAQKNSRDIAFDAPRDDAFDIPRAKVGATNRSGASAAVRLRSESRSGARAKRMLFSPRRARTRSSHSCCRALTAESAAGSSADA